MFENKINYNIDNKRTKSIKSSMTFSEFEDKLELINMDISKFSRYFGIGRSTIYGWNKKDKLVIPLYVERIIMLIEKKNEIRNEVYKLYEANVEQARNLYEINTNEPIKFKKQQY
jgi:DNA-binding transcriptional regulator YiaG